MENHDKILLLEKVNAELVEKNEKLQTENEQLKSHPFFEYEREYQLILAELKEEKEKYALMIEELNQIKNTYRNELDKIITNTKDVSRLI